VSGPNSGSTLCIVVCGAGPVPRVGVLVELSQAAGWSVRAVVTPAATAFIHVHVLRTRCGAEVTATADLPAVGDQAIQMA
jgi:hypothetical protein